MSLIEVKEILLKLGVDAEFRNEFLTNRSEIFKRYDLSHEERQCFDELKSENQIADIIQKLKVGNGIKMSDIRI